MPSLLVTLVLVGAAFQDVARDEVGSGPEPSPNPVSWEFKFQFTDPQRIEVFLPDRGQTRTYWYMLYTVTNPGDRTQHFFPLFQLVTDDLQVIDTDLGISPLVFAAIRERHALTHRYLISPTEVIGDLKTGDDNAKESVAIWRQIDLNVDNFKIYVTGLSGESRFVRNPVYDPDQPETTQVTGDDGRTSEVVVNPKFFTLRKTLEIRYTLPGSPERRYLANARRTGLRWVMR